MRRHPVDLISLAFGLIFLAVGTVFVTGRVDAADLGTGWIAPGALLAAGVLLGAMVLNRKAAAPVEERSEALSGDDAGA